MSKILFSSFIVMRYGSIDKDQVGKLAPKLAKPELGIQEYVSGFVPCNPLDPTDLVLRGGNTALYLVYETESHDYNKRRFLQRKRVYVAELESKGEKISELKGKAKSEREKEIKEAVQKLMREDRTSNIKVEETPIMISTSAKAPLIFIGISPKDERLSRICDHLNTLGVLDIHREPAISNDGRNNIAAYTSFLKDSGLINSLKVSDPLKPDDPPEIQFEIGGSCYLTQSNTADEEDKEAAKFTHFDLNGRQEIIDLLDNGKDAVSCEFRFKYDERNYKFTHGFEDYFSSVVRIKTKGEQKTEEQLMPSDQVTQAVYIMRILSEFATKMLEVV